MQKKTLVMQCFDFLQPYEHTKLKPCSCLCCFLGYDIEYKGCRCYDHFSRKLHISQLVNFLETSVSRTYSSAICPLLLISLKSSCWYFSWKLSLSWKSSFCHYALSSISQHISHEDSHSSYISSCPTWVRASPHYLTIIAIMLLLHFTNPTPTMRFSSNPLW